MAITTHHNPDGDAMGSSLGLAHLLRAAGHGVKVVLPNTPPAFLHWLPGFADCIAFDRDPNGAKRAIDDAALVFVLDFNRPDRVKDLEVSLRNAGKVVLIDHHHDPDATLGSPQFSDPAASSTAHLVLRMAEAMGWMHHVGKEVATCLYTGVMSDTGSFRFNSVDAEVFRAAALLVERGAEPHTIYDRVMDESSENRLRLLGFALSERMRVLPAMSTVVLHLTAADLSRFKHQPGDTEGVVNYGLAIQGIRLAVFFMERNDGIKISFRSKGELPVHTLCRDHFEGGGHKNAAGGRSSESLTATIARFEALLPAFIAAHPA